MAPSNRARVSGGELLAAPVGSGAEPWPLTHFCGIRAQEMHLVIAITCSVTAFKKI